MKRKPELCKTNPSLTEEMWEKISFTEAQWKKLLEHPALRHEDPRMLDLILIGYRHMLQLNKVDSTQAKKILIRGRKTEQRARERLFDIVNSPEIFTAMAPELDFLQAIMQAFHLVKFRRSSAKQIHEWMAAELKRKDELLAIYRIAEERIGRRRNLALHFLVRWVNSLSYENSGLPLSRSNDDVGLIEQIAEIGGAGIDRRAIKNAIQESVGKVEEWRDMTKGGTIAERMQVLKDKLEKVTSSGPISEDKLLAILAGWNK